MFTKVFHVIFSKNPIWKRSGKTIKNLFRLRKLMTVVRSVFFNRPMDAPCESPSCPINKGCTLSPTKQITCPRREFQIINFISRCNKQGPPTAHCLAKPPSFPPSTLLLSPASSVKFYMYVFLDLFLFPSIRSFE